MTDPAEETYFNKEYLGSSLWFGLGVVNLLGGLGSYMFIPTYVTVGKIWDTTWNWWTQQAWYWLIGGNMIWYYFMGLVWLFAFIRHPFF